MLSCEEFDQALQDFQDSLKSGACLEPLLLQLRQRGADKIDSIRIVKSAMTIRMAQAKSLVDCSDAWSDQVVGDLALHQALRQTIRQLSSEESRPKVVLEERSVDPI